jgi:hypothetical protein
MKQYRAVLLASTMLVSTLPLLGCGNSLEGGSGPSGSYIRVQGVTPTTLEPDIFLTTCSVDATTGIPTYEPGLTNSYATVTMVNQSAPNTPTGQVTNSYVTMNRYRVDFTGVSKSVSIPAINGAGQSVGIAQDGEGTMTVLVMDLDTLEYIRGHYATIGNGESLTLRATITIWGEDAFKVTVSTEAQITLVVDDYNRCGA